MSNRLPLVAAVLALTIVPGSVPTASGREPGRLAAFAARQDLHDEVCIAMRDGRISREERAEILTSAKKILTPDEYAGFKDNIDRISPPKPAVEKKSTPSKQVAEKKLAPPKKAVEKHPALAAKKKPSMFSLPITSFLGSTSVPKNTAKKPAKTGESFVSDQTESKEPDEVILTDRVAELGKAR